MHVKIGRNDPCWCGSMKKYKNCHQSFDEKIEELRSQGHIVPDHSLIKTPEQILSDIQDGTFAKDFLLDMSDAGKQVHFKAMRKKAAEHPSEKVGEEIRKLYSWNGEDKLINN